MTYVKRLIGGAAVLAAIAGLSISTLPAEGSTSPKAKVQVLSGVVGPGFNITITKSGKKVTRLPAGKYTLKVSDRADNHNLRLTGPGTNVATTVPFIGTKSFTVRLKKGTYTYVCDPHREMMRGSFKVS